jgi:Glycosyl hydrolase family 26
MDVIGRLLAFPFAVAALAAIPLGIQDAAGAKATASRVHATIAPAQAGIGAAGSAIAKADRAEAVLVPRRGVLLGAYVDDTGRWVDDTTAEVGVTRFEAQIGRRLDIDHHYYAWTDTFPTNLEEWDLANRRIPLISWGGAPLNNILAGRFDAMIKERALGVRALRTPVFLRWGWEMNGDWSVQDGSHNNSEGATNGPAKFIAAWRRIHRIFDAEGATNAVWVWSPNATDVPASPWNHWTRYYPGDAYVDWVGIDAYNWGTTRTWSSWSSLAAMIDRLYTDYATRKPIMIAETASADRGGNKAAWLTSVRMSLESAFPDVAALVYFETNKETDWSVRSSPAALQAFRALAHDPYFAPRAPRLIAAATEQGISSTNTTPATDR